MAAERIAYQALMLGWRVLDGLFPPKCVCCRSGQGWICDDCRAKMEPIQGRICDRCGKILNEQGECPICDVLPELYFTAIRSRFVYRDEIRDAIHQFKFNRKLALSTIFANELFSVYLTQGWKVDLIVPTPLSKERMRERGYNQTAWIASTFAARTGIKYCRTALQKVLETESQVALSETARRDNLKNAFQAEPFYVMGKTVLVVDDVLTTGATMNECSKALKRAGARNVYGLTVAATRIDPNEKTIGGTDGNKNGNLR